MKTLCLIMFVLAMSACSKPDGDGAALKPLTPESVTSSEVTVDDKMFASLEDMDEAGLGRRAQVEELGNCEVQDVGFQSRGCNGEKSLVVYLKNKGLYYPSMTEDLSDSPICPYSVGSYAKQALLEGLCFTNHQPFDQMSEVGFGHRAQADKLGNCVVKDVGFQSRGCNGEKSSVVYLTNKKVYYPSMTQDMSDSPTCPRSVGSYAKQAYKEGLCE